MIATAATKDTGLCRVLTEGVLLRHRLRRSPTISEFNPLTSLQFFPVIRLSGKLEMELAAQADCEPDPILSPRDRYAA